LVVLYHLQFVHQGVGGFMNKLVEILVVLPLSKADFSLCPPPVCYLACV